MGIYSGACRTLSEVEDSDLDLVSRLLKGEDLPTGQGALWPYDFSVLPADLVSRVYGASLVGRF